MQRASGTADCLHSMRPATSTSSGPRITCGRPRCAYESARCTPTVCRQMLLWCAAAQRSRLSVGLLPPADMVVRLRRVLVRLPNAGQRHASAASDSILGAPTVGVSEEWHRRQVTTLMCALELWRDQVRNLRPGTSVASHDEARYAWGTKYTGDPSRLECCLIVIAHRSSLLRSPTPGLQTGFVSAGSGAWVSFLGSERRAAASHRSQDGG